MIGATLKKSERICSFGLIQDIFCGNSTSSYSAYPIRLLTLPTEEKNSILISVPKRHFKHAVDRNRIKRQIREAYRKNKDILKPLDETSEKKGAAMAFIWISDRMLPSREVEQKVVTLLRKVAGSKMVKR